ncbi:MAG: hypothetical protein GDA56_27580 [Hormoscilla sp. GM7CHS1pb]|nr:hypothetical protein [Hormoscilla sp. GM7CHS1pb]
MMYFTAGQQQNTSDTSMGPNSIGIPQAESSPDRSTSSNGRQVAIIQPGYGSMETGFPQVNATIWAQGRVTQVTGKLPPAPQLFQNLNSLEKIEGKTLRKLTFNSDIVTNVSMAEIRNRVKDCRQLCNQWLQSQPFRAIADKMRSRLDPEAEVWCIIQTENPELKKLPWHLWNFFDSYPLAEVALSPLTYESVAKTVKKKQPRMLVLLGSDRGINLEPDRQAIEKFPAEKVILVQPTRQQLSEQLWDEKGFDIMCYCGHSWSIGDGRQGAIGLTSKDWLEIGELKRAFSAAIAQGLRLAIFNSCEGLGIAQSLIELNLAQTVVMRSPVGDRVAQEFLPNLLNSLSQGKSLYQGVRSAREKLEYLEKSNPWATWLPAIVQNPATLSW